MRKIVLSFLTLLAISCDKNDNTPDCSAVDCISLAIYVKLINSKTSNNYIQENNLTSDNISIINVNNESISFFILPESESIYNKTIAIVPNQLNQTISVENLTEILLLYEITPPKTNSCCDFGDIENLEVTSEYSSEFDDNVNMLTIYI